VTRAALLLAACLAALLAGRGAQAQELGRLFFTPEQRQALDARRKARVPDKPAAAVAAPTMRLDGYVKRSGGRSTVWVNGESTDDASRIPASSDGRVPVQVDTGGRVGLKPGQTLDRGSNEVRDVIGDGEIRVRPDAR
jgi:predicted deacylase